MKIQLTRSIEMNINKSIALVVLLFSGAAQANIVQNGSFENGNFVNTTNNFMQVNPADSALSNWTVVNEHIAWGLNASGFSASDGIGFVDMSGFGAQSPNSQLQQLLNTSIGAEYFFSVERQGGISDIFIDGAELTLTAGGTLGGWITYTGAFTATSTSTLLSIDNASSNNIVFVDNVSVISAVPVPAAILSFGTGIIGLIGFAKRKKV